MIARELINDLYPPLKLSDSGLKALNWMEEFRVEHLPIVDGIKYVGLVSEEDVLRLNSLDQPLGNQHIPLIKPYIDYNKPVFEVVKVLSKEKLTVIPVLDEAKNYLGLITLADVLKHYSDSGVFNDATGVIVIEVRARDYSMAELAHLIEQEDAKIISAYTTPDLEKESLDVTFKVNQTELSRIISSFTRHGFFVKEHYNQSEFIDDIKSRYDSLMNYLGI